MSVGTAFYPRTAPLNTKLQWREWSGYLAASAYSDSHEIEYNAIREAAALIDVSPLYKYLVSGPDATRLVDRVITRDASKLAVGRVYYTSWCNEDGRVVDDGTVARLEEQTYRWTAADSSLRWLRMNARGLDVEIEDVSERISALAVQGPLSRDVLEAATETSWGDLKYFGRQAAQVGSIPVDVSRTGYTGDLGYEVWVESAQAVELWDALVRAGSAYGIRPAGMLALDIARIEAGLILIEVDFDSVRRALIPEQSYSPFELGVLGRFVDFEKPVEFVGRRALEREQGRGGPPRRLVGLELDWEPLEELYRAKGLTPTLEPAASRVPVPAVRAGPPDRQGDQHDVEPDTEEGGCAGVSRCRPKQARHEDRRRVDGGGAAQPDGGDGGGAAVLQPDAQDLDGRSFTSLRARHVRSSSPARSNAAIAIARSWIARPGRVEDRDLVVGRRPSASPVSTAPSSSRPPRDRARFDRGRELAAVARLLPLVAVDRRRAGSPRPRSPPCRGRRPPSGSRAGPGATSPREQDLLARRDGDDDVGGERLLPARGDADAEAGRDGVRPLAVDVPQRDVAAERLQLRAAARPFTPAPITAADAGQAERLRRERRRRPRAQRGHRARVHDGLDHSVSAFERITTPLTVGRPARDCRGTTSPTSATRARRRAPASRGSPRPDSS